MIMIFIILVGILVFLKSALEKAKFTKIERVINFNIFEDTSSYKPYGFPISLNIVAFK